jgi:LysM domain
MCSRRVAGARDGNPDCRCPALPFATVRSHVLPIEQVSDYCFEHRSEQFYRGRPPKMTIITRENPTDLVVRPVRPRRDVRRRPRAHRPPGAALPSRGTGVLMSRASHRRRPITPLSTVVLALIAAAITVWLGLVAQLGGSVHSPDANTSVPSRLAVVQVQSGESLQQLAQRIAPDAPTGAVVDQIRELNELDSSAVDAGQTLIAPVG